MDKETDHSGGASPCSPGVAQVSGLGKRWWLALARRAYPPPGRCRLLGLLALQPGRLGGELGAGGEVKLGEHVREMGLHGPA
jgi:hypothetical protein